MLFVLCFFVVGLPGHHGDRRGKKIMLHLGYFVCIRYILGIVKVLVALSHVQHKPITQGLGLCWFHLPFKDAEEA